MKARLNGHTLERSEVDALKARADLAAVVRESGVPLRQLGRNLVGRCPFHEDSEASLVVNLDKQLWNCFGCQTGGDVLSFLQLREGLAFPQALERLQAWSGPPPAKSPEVKSTRSTDEEQPRLPGGYARSELLGRVADLYAQRLREHRGAQQYLAGRGLESRELWDAFRVGVSDGSLLTMLPESGEIRDALTAIGVLNKKGKEHFSGCIVVPLEHPDHGVVGLYGRRMSPQATVKHLYLPGPQRGVLNWQALQLSREIHLAESVFDALSLWVAGCRDVTCLYGARGLHVDLEELLGRFGTAEVRLVLDADRAGEEGAERLSERLAQRGIRCRRVTLPEGSDPNQLLVQQGAAALREALDALPPAAPEPRTATREETGDGFTLRFGAVAYRVTPRPPFTGRLRVTLRVSEAGRTFLDTIDLFSHRARSVCVSAIARRLDLAKDEVERHFVALLQESESWAAAVAAQEEETSGDVAVRKAPEMSATEREEAMAFLRDPGLVEAILEDMEALGYVGEERGKLLAYLIGVSRKLDRPLSGIVLSQSGAGKSSLADMVELLTPPEDVVLYSRISAQALGYLPRDFLKRKLLILEERVGAEAADYQIRVLQSRQRLSQAVVIKDPTTGKMRTRHFEVEGPIAYIETTTNPRINHENATRCFEISLDESEEQTRRIHERQREGRSVDGLRRRQRAEAIRRRHYNAQRLLEPVRVVIPYVSLLSFPSRWLRTRRDHERFLCLVEAAAFLQQHQREPGELREEGSNVAFIRATAADYALAYNLAREVLGVTLHELSRDGQELLEMGRAMVGDGPKKREAHFTRRDLRNHSGWQDHRLREALRELVEMEYVAAIAGSQGRAFQYRLLGDDAGGGAPLGELTTPAQLEALLKGVPPG